MNTVHTNAAGDLTLTSLDRLTGPELAAVYQELTGKTLKKFHSREEGVERLTPVIRKLLQREVRRTEASQTPHGRARKTFKLPATGVIRNYKRGTIREKLIKLLLKGGTFEEAQRVTGWGYHQTYDAITMLHIYTGFGVKENRKGVIKLTIA